MVWLKKLTKTRTNSRQRLRQIYQSSLRLSRNFLCHAYSIQTKAKQGEQVVLDTTGKRFAVIVDEAHKLKVAKRQANCAKY